MGPFGVVSLDVTHPNQVSTGRQVGLRLLCLTALDLRLLGDHGARLV